MKDGPTRRSTRRIPKKRFYAAGDIVEFIEVRSSRRDWCTCETVATLLWLYSLSPHRLDTYVKFCDKRLTDCDSISFDIIEQEASNGTHYKEGSSCYQSERICAQPALACQL